MAHYRDTTPQRTKLLDAFMAFLVAVGALQFVYCVLAGNYVCFLPLLLVPIRLGWWVGGKGSDGAMLTLGLAVQRVLVGLLGDGGAVCLDW